VTEEMNPFIPAQLKKDNNFVLIPVNAYLVHLSEIRGAFVVTGVMLLGMKTPLSALCRWSACDINQRPLKNFEYAY
jgi:hypothetical protein